MYNNTDAHKKRMYKNRNEIFDEKTKQKKKENQIQNHEWSASFTTETFAVV